MLRWAIAVWLSGSALLAQTSEYSQRVWRTQDGLPQSRIQAITQTPDGYLWIGTSGGLVRFDGARFVVFDRSNTAEFRDDSILALCPARDGSLWIGSQGGGLLRYAAGVFRTFGRSEGLTNGFVRAIFEDSRKTVWVGTDRGFFKLENDRLTRLDGTAEIPYVAVSSIAEDREGHIWLAGASGLLSVGPQGLSRFISSPVESLRQMRDGSLRFGLSGGVSTIQDGNVFPVHDAAKAPNARVLYEDQDGALWVGTVGAGLIRYRGGSRVVYDASGVLPSNAVLALFEDRDRNLWVGTQGGLVRFSQKFVSTLSAKEGLSDDDVMSVYEDRRGTLWIATGLGRLYQFSAGRLSPFHIPGNLGTVNARLVFEDRKGAFWIGTSAQGLIRLMDGKATLYTTKDGFRTNSMRAFLEDRNGELWVGTGSGLSRWTGTGFRTYYIEDGLAYGSVRSLAEDRNGDLWVGTDGGLSLIHDGKFVPHPAITALGSERIWALHADPGGTLWMGTRGRGLFRLANGKLTNFTTRDGLPSNNIYTLLEDPDGSLWMSSPVGVFRVSRKDLDAKAAGAGGPFAVIAYGTADGMESSEMNGGAQPSACWSADGRLWFPSVKGAVRIDPKQVRVTHAPPVVIEELIADDRQIPVNGPIRLEPGAGKLEIHYTALNLLSPERINFKYRLQGFDNAWTETSARRVAYYTGLPPGRYQFQVIASDVGAPQTTAEAVLSFVWAPHFYQTNWFYGLCAVFAAICVWAAFQLYARQTRARYALLLAERTRLAREMHDTVIQGCVGVSTLLEAASGAQQSNPGMTGDLLDRARAQVRLTLDEARQAVWDLRQGSFGANMVGTLSEFTQQLSRERNIPVETEVVGAPAALDDRTDRALLLVAREAVRNAVAHANPKRINIRLNFEPAKVSMEVVDDGCGFRAPAVVSGTNGHYGLVGMRERIEQLGGVFGLVSQPGQGTKVIAQLPLPAKVKA